MDPVSLARQIESFLAAAPEGVVREEGRVLFDLSAAQYTVSAERGKCLVHFWSEERNSVRHVLDSAVKGRDLQLTVQRLGQMRPNLLEICHGRQPGCALSKPGGRKRYQSALQSALRLYFPEWKLDAFTSTMDLERSFGPAYVRGIMRRGHSAFAVVGVNGDEFPGTIHGALTIAILWLNLCREQAVAAGFVEGLRLFVPSGVSDVVQIRMSYLDPLAVKWQLFEFDERSAEIEPLSLGDHGNIDTRLTYCPDRAAASHRFASSIARITAIVPEAEIAIRTEHEVAFRFRGVEFARASMALEADSFQRHQIVTFGAAPHERKLTDANTAELCTLMDRLKADRQAGADTRSPLWRMQPERWLESMAIASPAALDPQFASQAVYSQVPAFAASDRGMIDILTCTAQGRLAVIELKAEEDLHLPLQGLDYWARVKWHHERPSGVPGQRGEFQRFGYFAGANLSPAPPLLYLVAPALRLHPTTDVLLRYFAPEIDWTVLGLDERWREKLKVVFRKTKRSSAEDRA